MYDAIGQKLVFMFLKFLNAAALMCFIVGGLTLLLAIIFLSNKLSELYTKNKYIKSHPCKSCLYFNDYASDPRCKICKNQSEWEINNYVDC